METRPVRRDGKFQAGKMRTWQRRRKQRPIDSGKQGAGPLLTTKTSHKTKDKNLQQMKTEVGRRHHQIEDGDEIGNRNRTKIAQP
jgi:hypothetical protein